MDDYIKRSDALKVIETANRMVSSLFEATMKLCMTMNSIASADVVPVVRCAECKWFQINMRQDGYLPKGVPECECRHWCGPCDPTDFCSYGARMDGDGDV